MLIRKIQRHDADCTSQPPRNGPIAVMIPPSPDHAPIAAARSSGTKLASRIARLPGVSNAAPSPCSARAAMSTVVFGATAQSSDAPANHTTPVRNTRRRPNRSPSAPPRRRNPASVNV